MADALLRAAAADLELRLAGAAPADAAGEARERVVLLAEARQGVLELRELDLELAVRALGALREDVEDELRAVDDLEIALLGDRRGLRGREIAIEDEDLRVELHGADDDLVELALAEHELRVDALAHLEDGVDDLDARRVRELAELADALVGDADARRARTCRRRGARIARPSLAWTSRARVFRANSASSPAMSSATSTSTWPSGSGPTSRYGTSPGSAGMLYA